MAITFRHGNEADFDPSRMRTAEPATFDDSGKMMIAINPGVVKELMTVQSATALIDERIDGKVDRAETAADNAETSETNAENSATTATTNAGLSKSYAVGTGGVVREGDDTDCAKYYYEQAAAIVDVEIATTEKAGIVKPDGTTITVTTDGTISSVGGGVTGIKGDSETEYRTGNVSISANNVGAYSKSEVDGKLHTNLLNPTLQTTTSNGVTCTNNGDGTYTLNGTATATTTLILASANCSGKYKLLGCPNGGSSSAYKIGGSYNEYGDGKIFELVGMMTATIVVYKNAVCNNLLFKPMLTTDLNATYNDFVPYTGDTGTIQGDLSQTRKSISDAWTSSKTYSVGEYCIYGNSLWKCLIQNSNTTPTEGSYWTSVSVGSELSNLIVDKNYDIAFSSISSNSHATASADITMSGYTPIAWCVCQNYGSNWSELVISGASAFTSSTLTLIGRNAGSTALSNVGATIKVTYVKD